MDQLSCIIILPLNAILNLHEATVKIAFMLLLLLLLINNYDDDKDVALTADHSKLDTISKLISYLKGTHISFNLQINT